jgi:hypothetical protein
MEILIFKTSYPTRLAVKFYKLVENAQVTIFHILYFIDSFYISVFSPFSILFLYFFNYLFAVKRRTVTTKTSTLPDKHYSRYGFCELHNKL